MRRKGGKIPKVSAELGSAQGLLSVGCGVPLFGVGNHDFGGVRSGRRKVENTGEKREGRMRCVENERERKEMKKRKVGMVRV